MTPTVRRILLSQSLEKKVQSIVRRNGIAMYVPIPGVTCFQDSACTIPAAVDDPVGGLKDYLGLYPATQATSGYRPILRGKVKNWVKYSKDFSNASWTKRGSAVVNPVPVTGPFGDLDGWEISGLKLNGNNDIYKYIDTIAPSIPIAPSCYIQKTTYEGIIRLQNSSSNALGDWTIDLSLLSSDWERISVTHPAVTVVSAFITDSSGDSGFYLKGGSDVTEAAFRISAAQIELGSVANPYVPTTSAPASSSYGPYWLDFDGVDDLLEIANPFFQDIDTYGFYSIVMSVSKASLEYNTFINPCAKDNDAPTLCALHYGDLNTTYIINWDSVIADQINISASMTNKHLFSFKKASQTFLSYVDTVFNTTLQIRTSYTGNHAAIGARRRQGFSPTQLNFYGMYNGKTNISDKDKALLDSYLMKKSGLSI